MIYKLERPNSPNSLPKIEMGRSVKAEKGGEREREKSKKPLVGGKKFTRISNNF